jgi:peptide/nickel transport system substrate-binding protein
MMLRGNRWQLVALIVAALVFVGVAISRPTQQQPAPQPTRTAAPQTVSSATSPAETTPVHTPEATSAPVIEVVQRSNDGIPTYREVLIGRVQRLNPLFATLNPVDADITALIFEGLTTINVFGEPVPALAKSWLTSSDGLEYVFTLRDDVLWHDGERFTAADVAFTMSLLRSPDFPGQRALRDFWRTVETEQLSDTLIRFRLTQPLGSFPDALRIGILPSHVFTGMPVSELASHPFNFAPIGTGPYQLESLRGADGTITQVDLRVSPNFRQRPEAQDAYRVERVSFVLIDSFDAARAALAEGAVDGLAARSRQERAPLLEMAASDLILPHNAIEPTLGVVIFNWANESYPVFTEERVRRALLLGTDRRKLVERTALYTQAVPAESPLIAGGWAADPLLTTPYDLSQATFLLNEARIDLPEVEVEEGTPTPDPASASRLNFTLLVADDPVLVDVAQQLAAQWAALNVTVTVEPLDGTQLQERLDAGLFHAALVELTQLGTADPDVYDFWHDVEYPDGKNVGGVNDRLISEMLERARREPNGLNRKAAYQIFQTEFMKQAIAIPLYYPIYTYAMSPRVTNVQLGYLGVPSDRFVGIGQWVLGE